jgi:hypothetical protein
MQTANKEADPRTNREGANYPAIGSVVAKHRGVHVRNMPAYVALNLQDPTHIAWGGYLGKQYDPFVAKEGRAFELPGSLTEKALADRCLLHAQLDRMERKIDLSGSMSAMDRFTEQAVNLIVGRKAREAFDLSREPVALRER